MRGSSNANQRGSSYARKARKLWLLKTYAANEKVLRFLREEIRGSVTSDVYEYATACRCYRCGELLTFDTLTVDRIVPGCKGGTYARNNIRPACGPCNSETGGRTRG